MPPAVTRIPYPGLADFSVDDEGRVVMVRIQGNRLLLRCHRGSGFVGEELVVAQTPSEAVLAPGDTQPHQLVFKDTGGGRPMVVLSRAGGHALVTWWVSRPGGSSRRGPSSRAIDARRCAAMTPPFAWSADPTEGDYLYDTASDDAGRFVLFGRTKTWDGLRVMAADGTLLHQVSAPCPKGSNGYGRHVAMNQVTGDGVVTCQGHSSDPIHLRRFAFAQLPAMLDPGWVPVEGSGGGMSAWYESHVVGMNDEGGIAIEWSACPIKYLLANTYDADARIVHKFQLGPVGDRCWDPFRDNRASIGVVNGGFLFRDGERGYNTAWTHSPSGLRRLQATLPADYEIDLLRASGESDVWGATNAGTIVWHPVNLVLRTTDRRCTKVSTSCPEGTVQVADATPTRDITCGTPKPVPPAAGGDTPTSCPPGQYLGPDTAELWSTGSATVKCLSLSECGAEKYESTPPTATSDRLCSDKRVCAAHEFDASDDPTTDRQCRLTRACGSGECESAAPTATTDRQCADAPPGPGSTGPPPAGFQSRPHIDFDVDASGNFVSVHHAAASRELVVTCMRGGATTTVVVSAAEEDWSS